jgi:hypothetical protein
VLTVREQDGGVVYLPLDGGTSICRIVCGALWSELRPGDDIFAGLEQIGGMTITRFVDVNLAGGWIAVDAVASDRLVVHWSRPGARPEPFQLFLGLSTRWDSATGDTRVCAGDVLHFTASADVPIAATSPPPDMWAFSISATPKPECDTFVTGVRTAPGAR